MSGAVVWESSLRPMAVRAPGHKHAVVCMIAAAVASGCRLRLENAPDIEDTRVLERVVVELGGGVDHDGGLTLDAGPLDSHVVPAHLSARVHGTLYLLPALLARFGSVRFPGAGGCQLGRDGEGFHRPDAHVISVLEKFGATFERQGDCLIGHVRRLRACDVDIMEYSESVSYFLGPLCTGATKAAVLAAMGCDSGITRILNPIRRPEISALLSTVRTLGYQVHEAPDCIEIGPGTPRQDTCHRVLSDLSAIVTYLACAAYHRVPLHIRDVTVDQAKEWLEPELRTLTEMGARLKWAGSDLRMAAGNEYAPIELEIMPEGFATDHQPFFALLALKANGRSVIRDRVWPDRFRYADELRKLGGSIADIPQGIVIEPGLLTRGGQAIRGADLRSAAILLIAALGVPNFTRVEGLEHLCRGYEDLIQTLRDHGGQIEDGQGEHAES